MNMTDESLILHYAKDMVKPMAGLSVVAISVILSRHQQLGLEKEMIISITRAFVQLSALGFVLQYIFSRDSMFFIFVTYFFMVAVAGHTAGVRAKHVPNGKYIAAASILAGTMFTKFVLLLLHVFPYTPRYMIPVSGMMIGSAMTVTGVTMKRLRDDIRLQMNLVETKLALGATPSQAIRPQVKRAVVIALSPVLDSAKAVGLITLPGAMTGLIMGGASPIEAIQLQMVVMNMLIGAATISSVISTYLCWPGFFTSAHQLQAHVFTAE